MKFSTGLESALLLIAYSMSAIAAEPLELKKHQIEPKYLIPVGPHGRDDKEVIENLLGNRWGNGTMICVESERGDFAVSAWTKNEDSPNRADFLTYMQVVGKGRATRIKQQVDVPIDADFSTAIQRAWARMLLKTRYPESEYRGADGFDAEFSVWVTGVGGVFGYAWSPSKGFVKEITDLSLALVEYCKISERNRPEKRKQLIDSLKDFERRVAAAE